MILRAQTINRFDRLVGSPVAGAKLQAGTAVHAGSLSGFERKVIFGGMALVTGAVCALAVMLMIQPMLLPV